MARSYYGKKMLSLMFVAATALLLLLASPSQAASGTATYYTTYTPSACYGYDTTPFLPNNMIAAASSAIYNNGAACGSEYQISCTGAGCNGGGPITVKIVDLCPGCAATQFDLSSEAFSAIADLAQGRININYSLL